MERINSMLGVLATFSLFPYNANRSVRNFEEKIAKYQHTDQYADFENIKKDWQNIGSDIKKAMDKIEDEQA